MVYPKIKVKNAYITKHKNRFYDEPHYDYLLRLDEKTYNVMKEEGLPAKSFTSRFTEEPIYFIKVTPVWEFDPIYDKRIPEPEEKDFLERDGVDITFRIYSFEFKGKTYKKLYFSKSSIKETKNDRSKAEERND